MKVDDIQVQNFSLHTASKMDIVKKTDSEAEARDKKLRDTARGFESIFISQLMKTMEKTITPGGTSNNSSSNMSGMMFSQVFGEAISKQGGIGLADSIYSSLKRVDGMSVQEYNESTVENKNDEL